MAYKYFFYSTEQMKFMKNIEEKMGRKYTKEEYKKLAQTAYDVAKRDFDSEDFKRAFLENRNKLLEHVTKWMLHFCINSLIGILPRMPFHIGVYWLSTA